MKITVEKVTISKNKKSENMLVINMTITTGKALAMVNALNEYSKKSQVAEDLKNMVVMSAQDSCPEIIS